MNGTYEARGLTFNIRLEKEGDIAIIRENVEEDVYRLLGLKAQGFEPKTVVDVGACIGTFTKFAHSLWPHAEYHCFEPNPRSFELLKLNCPFATCYNLAVGDPKNTILTDGVGATGGGYVTTEGEFETAKAKADGFIYSVLGEVETISFEAFVDDAGFGTIDLLKLDCEGGEWPIIRELTPKTARKIKKLVGEYHIEFDGQNVYQEFTALLTKKLPHINISTDHPTLEIASFYSA
jgi:FkbM family methyltransferase